MTRSSRWLAFALIAVALSSFGLLSPRSAAALSGNPLIPLRAALWSRAFGSYDLKMGGDDVLRWNATCSGSTTNPVAYYNVSFQGMARLNNVWYFKYNATRDSTLCSAGTDTATVLPLDLFATRLVDAPPGATSFAGDYSRSGALSTLDHATAWQMTQNAGIPVVASGCGYSPTNCVNSIYVSADRTQVNGTSLKDIRRNTIAGIIKFKLVSGQSFMITGGSETWTHSSGTYSHHAGYKVDISTEPSSHIVNSYGPSTTATQYGSSYPAYLNNTPSGEIFYDERSAGHWDVLYRY